MREDKSGRKGKRIKNWQTTAYLACYRRKQVSGKQREREKRQRTLMISQRSLVSGVRLAETPQVWRQKMRQQQWVQQRVQLWANDTRGTCIDMHSSHWYTCKMSMDFDISMIYPPKWRQYNWGEKEQRRNKNSNVETHTTSDRRVPRFRADPITRTRHMRFVGYPTKKQIRSNPSEATRMDRGKTLRNVKQDENEETTRAWRRGRVCVREARPIFD